MALGFAISGEGGVKVVGWWRRSSMVLIGDCGGVLARSGFGVVEDAAAVYSDEVRIWVLVELLFVCRRFPKL